MSMNLYIMALLPLNYLTKYYKKLKPDKMKNLYKLFLEWQNGQYVGPKVYIVRIYFDDEQGNPQTCLKLGFTKQPLHTRFVRFMYDMRRATGYKIKQYELVSFLYTSSYSKLEYALHSNNQHLYFFNSSGKRVVFTGYTEILQDTPENCNLIQHPALFYHEGECIVPYKYRKPVKPVASFMDNVV